MIPSPTDFLSRGITDGYIIGDVPASAFTAQQLQAIYSACNRGAGLMMTGGHQNFGKGGYKQTVLEPLFPVELPPENEQLNQPQKMLPDRDSLTHYVLQIASPEQNRSRWEQLPPLPANLLIRRNNSLAGLRGFRSGISAAHRARSRAFTRIGFCRR